jgi:hypothetical protein
MDKGARYLAFSIIFQPKDKEKKEHERLEKSSGSDIGIRVQPSIRT